MNNNEIFKEKYDWLNPEQKDAVDTLEGPVLVIAGPGTGKTQLLSMRVANILKNTDTLASSILCLTFTDSAAFNMRERLNSIVGPDAYKVNIHTFHSLGSEIIGDNPENFFFGLNYSPADETAQIKIMENIFSHLAFDNPLGSFAPEHGFVFLKDTQSQIFNLKRNGLSPDEFLEIIRHNQTFIENIKDSFPPLFNQRLSKKIAPEVLDFIEEITLKCFENYAHLKSNHLYLSIEPFSKILGDALSDLKDELEAQEKFSTKPITVFKKKWTVKDDNKDSVLSESLKHEKYIALADIYKQYQQSLHKEKLYDFEDMLLEVIKETESKKGRALKYRYQEKYLYILVDEFQDTNDAQIRLINNLIDFKMWDNKPNILAVGDDDQAVFKFQGANNKNIHTFMKMFSLAKVINLTTNYRSSQEILDFAEEIVQNCSSRAGTEMGIDKKLIAFKK